MSVDSLQNNKPQRRRKAVTPPANIRKKMSLYEYLRECSPPIDKKIIDIVCAQAKVPDNIKPEAAQEIALMWSQIFPDVKQYRPGQIASYAHGMARHTALRACRELSFSVRLPGSAFRKKRDGSTYITPGVLASPLDWNEMENWFQTDNLVESGSHSKMAGLINESELSAVPETSEDFMRAERLDLLERKKHKLSPRQAAIIKSLIEGATYEEIMQEHNIKKGVLMREVASAGASIGLMFGKN